MERDFVQEVIEGFTPINLQNFNATANFLDRVDKKFLVHRNILPEILTEIQKDFYVLEIDWRTIFWYKSVYMDTDNYELYNAHANWDKKRVKIRNRQYTDSWITFFEFKQKDKKLTRKFRYQVQPNLVDNIDKEWTRFIDWIYQSLYSKNIPELSPSLETKYKRITFAGKNSSEKLTIDMWLEFQDIRSASWSIRFENLAIIESKSTSDNRRATEILEKFWIISQNQLSKYCLWVAYHGKHNLVERFRDTMKVIDDLESSKKKIV